MKLSILMATRNREKELIRFIESLKRQISLPQEFIVIDSSDIPLSESEIYQKAIQLLDKTIDYKYIHSEKGLTKQRNIGVSKASGDVYFFFDDDIVLDPSFLAEICTSFLSDSTLMGGMGLITNEVVQISFSRDFFPSFIRFIVYKIYKLLHAIFFLEGGNSSGKFSPSGFSNSPNGATNFMLTDCLSGGLTAYKKEVFDIFHFDESVTGYSYLEDIDFSSRVSKKYPLFYNPKAKCLHLHGAGGRGDLVENRKGFILNYRYFFYKNFYNDNVLNLLAHYWSLFGLFVEAVFRGFFIPMRIFKIWKGYCLGLSEFSKRKAELLKFLA